MDGILSVHETTDKWDFC